MSNLCKGTQTLREWPPERARIRRPRKRTAELLVGWPVLRLTAFLALIPAVLGLAASRGGANTAHSGEGRRRRDVRAGRRHGRPSRRVPVLGRGQETRSGAALPPGLPRPAHERLRSPGRGHRRRHRARGGDDHGARPGPALRPVEGLLGGGRHRRHRYRGGVARIGGVGRVDRRRRPRPRDRRARDPGRLEDGHGAAAQVGPLRAAEGDRRHRGGVPPRSRPGRVGLPAHEGHDADRLGRR